MGTREMKEIKFRVWDNIHEIMMKLSEVNTYSTIDIISNVFKDSLNVMQFTGLFDKQGVEIYEGDIIKDSSNRLMTVEWDRRVGTSRFIFRVINTIGHIKVGRFVNTHEWIMPDDNDIEVVGNIYENPELLKGEI